MELASGLTVYGGDDRIDDVTYDVMPGSMRTHHSNINCCFARQFAHASYWSGHVLLKLPPHTQAM